MIKDLYKNRSYTGCMRAAFIYLCDNFTLIVKKCWVWIAACSLIAGLTAYAWATTICSGKEFSTAPLLIAAGIGAAALFVTSAALTAQMTGLLSGKTFKSCLFRVMKTNALTWLTTAVAILVTAIASSFTAWMLMNKDMDITSCAMGMALTAIVLSLLFASLHVPLIYSCGKYVLEEDTRFVETMGRGYAMGFKYFGQLFAMSFVIGLINIVEALFMGMPLLILSLTGFMDYNGRMVGDESGLPAGWPLQALLAATIIGVLLSFMYVWTVLCNCYAYGHIEQDLCNKRKMQEANKEL